MAKCDACGSTIVLGGVRDNDLRYCNKTCQQQGPVLSLSTELPEDIVAQQVTELHQGDCPRCGGPGPVDIHTSHLVWSILVVTSWNSRPELCCRACGVKAKLRSATISALFGWWGFPWGVIVTPIQVVRNIGGLLSGPAPDQPSADLEQLVRTNLAAHVLQSNRARTTAA